MGSRYERARICQKTFAVHARIAEFHVPNGPGRPAAQRLPRSANSATRHSAASDMHGERFLTFRAVLATQTPPRASAMVSLKASEKPGPRAECAGRQPRATGTGQRGRSPSSRCRHLAARCYGGYVAQPLRLPGCGNEPRSRVRTGFNACQHVPPMGDVNPLCSSACQEAIISRPRIS